MGDLSPRTVRTLREVRLIAAEDTRATRKLLTHFDLHTLLTSYYEHNKLAKLDSILAALTQGDVALVSDAGTPAINDPGYELVQAALAAGHSVCPIPGQHPMPADARVARHRSPHWLRRGCRPIRSCTSAICHPNRPGDGS